MKGEVDTDALRKIAEAGLAQAKDAYAKELEAIAIIERHLTKPSVTVANTVQAVVGGHSAREWTTLRAAIQDACNHVNPISAPSVTEYVYANFARRPAEKSIASTLRKLLRAKELRRVREASAGKPTIYELIKDSKAEA